MHDGTEHSLVCWALPSAHHHQHITMPRVLLVGSSHMARVVNHLEENPPPFAIYLAAKEGLRADQGLDFLKRQHGAIFRFRPTHAILLLGGCDLLPKRVEEPTGAVGPMIDCVRAIQEWLKENFQVQVFHSELLPHAVWEGKPRELSAQKWAEQTTWKAHNAKVLHICKNKYRNKLDNIVHHPRLWEYPTGSAKTAKNALFDTTSTRYWGLHLNEAGTAILCDDFLTALQCQWVMWRIAGPFQGHQIFQRDNSTVLAHPYAQKINQVVSYDYTNVIIKY